MSLIKTLTGLINNTDTRVARIDPSTNSLQTIEYEHHEIHSGSHFFISDVADIAINTVFDIQFTTPNTTEWVHFTFKLDCEAETEWYIYENVTIVTPGTGITPLNNNRNSAHASTATVASISNTSVANANADTTVAAATVLMHGIIGAGRSGGDDQRSREIILKQNEDYCFRAIANAAGYVDFTMDWYEHTDKD